MNTHSALHVPRSFKEHSRVEIAGIEISDCTRSDNSRAIWIGPDGINGRWVDADQARALAAALLEAADICDAFDADQTMREEHEIALFNLAPGQRAEAEAQSAGEVAA